MAGHHAHVIATLSDDPIVRVSLSRLWHSVVWPNTNLDVIAVKVFCRCDKHLQSIDF